MLPITLAELLHGTYPTDMSQQASVDMPEADLKHTRAASIAALGRAQRRCADALLSPHHLH